MFILCCKELLSTIIFQNFWAFSKFVTPFFKQIKDAHRNANSIDSDQTDCVEACVEAV